jgi:hypothetical protein
MLVLGQKLILGKCSNYTLSWWSGSPPTPTFMYLSQDICQQHNEICNIYATQMRLHPPFQSFYEQEVQGGWRSHVRQC